MACNNNNCGNCSSCCHCDATEELKKFTGEYTEDRDSLVERMNNAPSAFYVSNRITEYIFSDGIISSEQEKLDECLKRQNSLMETNENVLRYSKELSFPYGSCGVRVFEGNLYQYLKGTYAKLEVTDGETGVKSIFKYIVNVDGSQISDDFKKNTEYDNVLEYIKSIEESKTMVALDTNEFFEFTHSGTMDDTSPLDRDKLRFDLLSEVHKRAKKDAINDGPIRLILHEAKDGKETRTSLANANYSKLDKREIKGKRAEEVRRDIDNVTGNDLTKMLKAYENSSSSQVLFASSFFSDKVTFLPRTTVLSDYKWLLDKEDELVARAYGVNPAIIGIGRQNGNISMEYVIDNDMKNSIIPMRKKTESQFINPLKSAWGLSDIHFGEYEPKGASINEKRSEIIDLIARSKELGLDEQVSSLVEEFNDTFVKK